jgi:hypothetical protein
MDRAKSAAIPNQFFDCLFNRFGGQVGFDSTKRSAQACCKHDILLALTSQCAGGAKRLIEAVNCRPAEFTEQRDGWLLDEGIFGIAAYRSSPQLSKNEPFGLSSIRDLA